MFEAGILGTLECMIYDADAKISEILNDAGSVATTDNDDIIAAVYDNDKFGWEVHRLVMNSGKCSKQIYTDALSDISKGTNTIGSMVYNRIEKDGIMSKDKLVEELAQALYVLSCDVGKSKTEMTDEVSSAIDKALRNSKRVKKFIDQHSDEIIELLSSNSTVDTQEPKEDGRVSIKDALCSTPIGKKLFTELNEAGEPIDGAVNPA